MRLILDHKVLSGVAAAAAIVLILVGVWAGNAVAKDHKDAVAESSEFTAMLPESDFTCKIKNLTAYGDRIQVRCAKGPEELPEVVNFASLNDEDTIRNSNQYLLLLNTAYALNQQVELRFDTSADANPPGCQVEDCRKLIGVATLP